MQPLKEPIRQDNRIACRNLGLDWGRQLGVRSLSRWKRIDFASAFTVDCGLVSSFNSRTCIKDRRFLHGLLVMSRVVPHGLISSLSKSFGDALSTKSDNILIPLIPSCRSNCSNVIIDSHLKIRM